MTLHIDENISSENIKLNDTQNLEFKLNSGEITNTKLVGNISHDTYLVEAKMKEFLSKLEKLMFDYKIVKLDIAWNPFAIEQNSEFIRNKNEGK